MPTLPARAPKSKITVSVSPDLIHQLDRLLKAPEATSRSRLIEEAIRHWLRDQDRKTLDQQTEAYYRALSAAERKEDRQWTRLAARSAGRSWD